MIPDPARKEVDPAVSEKVALHGSERGGPLVERVRRTLHSKGLLGLTQKLAKRLARLVYIRRQLLIYRADVSQAKWFGSGRAPIQEPLVDVTIRLAEEADLPRLRKVTSAKEYRRIRRWFKDGNYCFLALSGEEVVYYIWFTFKDHMVEALKMPLRVGPTEVFPYMSETLPTYKNRNIFPATASKILTFCVKRGRHIIISAILPEDYRAFKAIYMRKGFGRISPDRLVTYRRILGLRFHETETVEDEARLLDWGRSNQNVGDRRGNRAKSMGISQG